MKYLGSEQYRTDDKFEGSKYSYNLYFDIDKEEEVLVDKIMKYFKFLKYFFFKRNDKKELLVLLPNTTKERALNFSKKLVKKIIILYKLHNKCYSCRARKEVFLQ